MFDLFNCSACDRASEKHQKYHIKDGIWQNNSTFQPFLILDLYEYYIRPTLIVILIGIGNVGTRENSELSGRMINDDK